MLEQSQSIKGLALLPLLNRQSLKNDMAELLRMTAQESIAGDYWWTLLARTGRRRTPLDRVTSLYR
jgi:hypothetical protein